MSWGHRIAVHAKFFQLQNISDSMTRDNAENLPEYNSWLCSGGFEEGRASTTKHTDLPPINVLRFARIVRNQQVAVLVGTGTLDLVRWVNNKIDVSDIGFG